MADIRQVNAKEVADAFGEKLAAVGKWLAKDPMSAFLLVASVVIAILFFSLLDSIGPSSPGQPASFSTVIDLAKEKQVASAVLLDHDSRVVVETTTGQTRWAAYPGSDSQTTGLVRTLTVGGATVVVDQQSGKAARQIIVQFLLPILLLVCLFALFTRLGQDGGAGAFSGFSKFTGKGRKKGAAAPGQTT
ncbi:MAG: ATP-dependent metallopeptidase FtsH/Yme1/Tma family protein, partial [Solirubrobacterales bacterium]